jgi:transcriptional regulator with XRE-family HTH domain
MRVNDELHIVSLVCASVKEEAGLSVREIAKRMGIPGHQAQVQRIVDAKHPHNMTLKTLFRFADACGCVCNISFKKKEK